MPHLLDQIAMYAGYAIFASGGIAALAYAVYATVCAALTQLSRVSLMARQLVTALIALATVEAKERNMEASDWRNHWRRFTNRPIADRAMPARRRRS